MNLAVSGLVASRKLLSHAIRLRLHRVAPSRLRSPYSATRGRACPLAAPSPVVGPPPSRHPLWLMVINLSTHKTLILTSGHCRHHHH
jgi:hypothetical protein